MWCGSGNQSCDPHPGSAPNLFCDSGSHFTSLGFHFLMRNARLRVVEHERPSNFSDLGFSNICVNSMALKFTYGIWKDQLYVKNLSLRCMKFSFGKKVQEIMTRKEVLVGSDAEMTLSLLGVYIYFNLFFFFFSYRYHNYSKYKAPLPYYSVILTLRTVGCFLFQIPHTHTTRRGRGSFLKHLALPTCLLPTRLPQHWFCN